MAFTQADLDNIRECISSGTLKTRFADGREVTYQDLNALMNAETRIAAAVASATGTGRPRRRVTAYRDGL